MTYKSSHLSFLCCLDFSKASGFPVTSRNYVRMREGRTWQPLSV